MRGSSVLFCLVLDKPPPKPIPGRPGRILKESPSCRSTHALTADLLLNMMRLLDASFGDYVPWPSFRQSRVTTEGCWRKDARAKLFWWNLLASVWATVKSRVDEGCQGTIPTINIRYGRPVECLLTSFHVSGSGSSDGRKPSRTRQTILGRRGCGWTTCRPLGMRVTGGAV